MRRTNWKTVSTLIAMVVVAGCQENVASPSLTASTPARMSLAPSGRPSLDVGLAPTVTSETADFTVTPNGGLFRVGSNAVYFPARSICDPATSSYGVDSWNSSCTPLRSAIRIHAVATTVNGHPSVDFSPSLRFVPSNEPSRWVWLYMSMPGVTSATDLSQYNILYVPTLGGPAYDEAANDPTLRTYIGNGMGLRRIKHFSGYVYVGYCDTTCGDSENSSSTP